MKRPTLIQVLGPNKLKVIQAQSFPINLKRVVTLPATATVSFPVQAGARSRGGKPLAFGKSYLITFQNLIEIGVQFRIYECEEKRRHQRNVFS